MYISQNKNAAGYIIAENWISKRANILLQISELKFDRLKFEISNENSLINKLAIKIKKNFDLTSMKITYYGDGK